MHRLVSRDPASTPWASNRAPNRAPPYIEQTRAWFTAMWDNISYEFPA